MMRRSRQLPLELRMHGGRRPGSGRKRKAENARLLPHGVRPALDPRAPMHVTLRAVAQAPGFRTQRASSVIVGELRRASAKGFRVVHFSIQENHLHLIVEADGDVAMSRGMQRLASRIARLLNVLVARRGSLWRERYHRCDLASPRQFRNALVYVIFNARKHARGAELARRRRVLDGCSSAIWIDAWARRDILEAAVRARAGPPPVVPARTWTAKTGWHRHGLLRADEMPSSPG